MAAEHRDWYRDWWRKKTRYVERARFRMSEADYRKARLWASVAVVAKYIAAAAVVYLLAQIFLAIR